MFRSTLLLSALACMLAVGVQAEEVYVRVAPPRAIVETRPARPAAGYIWTPGYHRWDGHAHVWVAGAWVQPPRAHAVWVPYKWVHKHDGYVLVEGHWR